LDVQVFESHFEDNLFRLHLELKNKTYQHSNYTSFYITDPKLRHIHKACVRDRVVHHALYRVLYPIFDKNFIYDSYSCRIDKGTHRAVQRLDFFANKVSQKYGNCWALKSDISRFFDSVDHRILFEKLQKRISNRDALSLLWKIISSLRSRERERERERALGLPIGNLTSQLFANVYLNELDKFVKHELKIKYYLRYCDDFVILDGHKEKLLKVIREVEDFLHQKLKLTLHPEKISLGTLSRGIDFCGYVVFPYHRILRTKTKRRMLKRMNENNSSSYFGLLKHCNSYKLTKNLPDYS